MHFNQVPAVLTMVTHHPRVAPLAVANLQLELSAHAGTGR